jgi:shikimate kinase
MSKHNIVIMGFMGTGKSSVARVLATRLGMDALDMDDLIEEREGRLIRDIFAQDGEPYFRQLERAMVQELAGRNGLVIACGGGVVLNPDNIQDYSQTGTVVCLMAEPEEILARVARQTHRPLLEDGDKAERICSLFEQRRTLYESIPNRVKTDGKDLETVADEVLAYCPVD